MTDQPDIHKAGGVIIKDRRLLLTRSKGKDFFVAPGGKVEDGETSPQALTRELMEELQISVDEHELSEFGTFYAVAAGQDNETLQMDVYIVNKWEGKLTPSSEIEEICYFERLKN